MSRRPISFQKMLTIATVSFGVIHFAQAIPIPKSIDAGKSSGIFSKGVVAGGKASDEFSLLSVRAELTRSGAERWVLRYGDRFGKPIKGEAGFFHVNLDKGAKRIVIDLAQVHQTAVGPGLLQKLASKSSLVERSRIIMDPYDRTTSIVLDLAQESRIRVINQASVKGHLIVEISPAQKASDRKMPTVLPPRKKKL